MGTVLFTLQFVAGNKAKMYFLFGKVFSGSEDSQHLLTSYHVSSLMAKLFDLTCNWMNLSSSRLQRLRQRAQQQSTETVPPSVTEVNPEFLAALPPAIQEEVLAQQRLEQQRQAAAAANPNDPVDAAAFFQNLQPSLRQAVSEQAVK
jgi:hypothetical protein